MNFEWVRMSYVLKTPGECRRWELRGTGFLRLTAGTLVRRTNKEWSVYDAYGNPIAVLPKTLSFEEAKDAAKLLILLSLKQSEGTS
jgi:hypothetical protein